MLVDNHREEMMEQFHIGPEDLQANRSGVLTKRQARRLERIGLWSLAGALLIGLFLAATLYFVAEKPLVPIQWVLAGILFLAALAVGGTDFWRALLAAHDGKVACLTGTVRTRLVPRAGWFLRVDGRSFRLPTKYWHVRDGGRYRVYIAPKARKIVAMDPDE